MTSAVTVRWRAARTPPCSLQQCSSWQAGFGRAVQIAGDRDRRAGGGGSDRAADGDGSAARRHSLDSASTGVPAESYAGSPWT